MAKVSDYVCGLASSSTAATCHSLGARNESGGRRAATAGLSNSRRQRTWGPRENRVFDECLWSADRRGAESVTRGVQTKPARLACGVLETGSRRRKGGVKPAGTAVSCRSERWRKGEASIHVESGGSLCAKIGWRRRDRRWPGQHGVLAVLLVGNSGAAGVDGRRSSRETTMSHQGVFSFPRAAEAARADVATVDSLQAEPKLVSSRWVPRVFSRSSCSSSGSSSGRRATFRKDECSHDAVSPVYPGDCAVIGQEFTIASRQVALRSRHVELRSGHVALRSGHVALRSRHLARARENGIDGQEGADAHIDQKRMGPPQNEPTADTVMDTMAIVFSMTFVVWFFFLLVATDIIHVPFIHLQ
ncbi:hypothetical protein CBR_g1014 [Chara braunii]|uniref:Uncharacterized protein n=1 Tax=Chara braunii TaxID=69332 RepID=A0A388KCW7_CHABU|nr:hypothetical protein CBR_g1014 [Chara braunii]|eukprot:GBG67895.1 hypothetical protein CBR_g1014 [Chara braunii]